MRKNNVRIVLAILTIFMGALVVGCQRSTLDMLQQRVDKNPENPKYHEDLAYHLEELKRYEEAIEEYDKAIELRPDNNNFLPINNKGTVLYKMGRYEEALGIFQKLRKTNPDRSDLLSNIAMCYHHMEKFDQALKFYIMALESSPKNEPAKKGLEILQQDIEASGMNFNEMKAAAEKQIEMENQGARQEAPPAEEEPAEQE